MPDYTETELRNLGVVKQFFSEAPAPADKSELFTEDGIWWNGLPLVGDGETEHRGRAAIRQLLPSTRKGELGPGRDIYDMSTMKAEDVIMLADGDYVVRQQTCRARTVQGDDYANTYCFVFRFNGDGQIEYLTEHWNTFYAYQKLFNKFAFEPAHPVG
jgi:ketosteroid isomerase-like protein